MFQRSFQSLMPHVGSFCPAGKPVVLVVIWHSDWIDVRVYELSYTDFSVIRYASSPGGWPWGIGGNASKIWHCDLGDNLVYEL